MYMYIKMYIKIYVGVRFKINFLYKLAVLKLITLISVPDFFSNDKPDQLSTYNTNAC